MKVSKLSSDSGFRARLASLGASQLAVALPGILGVLVLGRALSLYLGEDATATAVIALMAVGLGVGLIELVVRQRWALALTREVDQLPSPASEAAVDRASPALRAFLRARIEHAPTPSLAENLTPYLIGLMVMLGLLGTLLGLFETLHGAGQALTASANVDALREGLSGPMRGLTRSFGCSAAGVSASAMLGLASVLVRRAEARAWARAHAYATGPLRELSPIRRQLQAFGQLTQQGEALPRAASALEQAAAQLGGLAERWENAHQRASEAQQQAGVQMIEQLRGELVRSVSDAGHTLSEGVGPLVLQMVSQTGDAASRHMKSTLDALERDLRARRDADAAMRAALREELASLRAWSEQDARSKAGEVEARLAAFEQLMRQKADEQAELLALSREQATRHLSTLEGAAQALLAQLDDEAQSRRDQVSRLLGDLAARLDQAAQERAQESRDELAALAELGTKIVAEGEARERGLATRWDELTRSLEARAHEARDRDAERLSSMRGELERQNAGLSQSWAQLAQRVEDAALASRSDDEARIARLDDLAKRIGEDLAGVSQGLRAELQERLERDRGLAERSAQALQALEHSAESMNDALARQDLGVQVLLERGSEQLSQLAAASQQGAREALEKLIALADAQAQRFVEGEARLSAGQADHTQALAKELSAHADRLAKGLEATTGLVHEAATVLQASSAEMGAVAEMFHKSVERQREAAQAWMESLGELEGAVERAGRGAAADALGDQLASTQEVFARQLQFQRELFEQLRSLRVAPAPASHHGEQDVSA